MHLRISLISGLFLIAALVANNAKASQVTTDTDAAGFPDPNGFSYGAVYDYQATNANQALNMAEQIGFEWVSIPFQWAKIWPDPTQKPDVTQLVQALKEAESKKIRVMIVISQAPEYAMATDGPDPAITAQIIKSMVKAFPNTILAVELFPGANTRQGWGKSPNPEAYLHLLEQVQTSLQQIPTKAIVIASVQPLSQATEDGIDDGAFLEALYQSHHKVSLPVIGISFPHMYGNPLDTSEDNGQQFLRHYEQIRQIMLKYQRNNDRIWITGFTWPETKDTPEEQAEWVYQAYELLKGQLFINVAFFSTLNSASGPSSGSLLQQNTVHPACALLRDTIEAYRNSIQLSFTTGQNSNYEPQAKPLDTRLKKTIRHVTNLKKASK